MLTDTDVRCDGCHFWVRISYATDCNLGECHRYAPRPTVGDFEYQVLKILTIIAWSNANNDERTAIEDGEMAIYKASGWSRTTSDDWCGEWQQRQGQQKQC